MKTENQVVATIEPVSWVRGWIGMLGTMLGQPPPWLDLRAYELALLDTIQVMGALPAGTAEFMDILGESALDFHVTMQLLARAFARRSNFRAAAERLALLMMVGDKSSPETSPLRAQRCEAVVDLLNLLLGFIAKRMRRLEGRARERERRALRRFRRFPDEFDTAAETSEPWEITAAREILQRYRDELDRELTPRELSIVRGVFRAPDLTYTDHAASAGVSSATVTRAMQRVEEVSRVFISNVPLEVARPFRSMIFEYFTTSA